MFTSQVHRFSVGRVSSVSRAPAGTSAARFGSIMPSLVAVKIFKSMDVPKKWVDLKKSALYENVENESFRQ